MEKEKKQLLRALEDGDKNKFYQFIDKCKSKTEPFDLAEFLQVIPNKDHVALFQSLLNQLKPIIENSDYVLSNEADAPKEQEMVVENSIKFMKGFILIAKTFIKEKKRVAPEPLRQSMELLHDITMELYQHCHQQQPPPKNVAELVVELTSTCETWYSQNRDGREHLYPQTISYLLMHAIDNGKQTDIKRVYALREGLMLIDFQDESSVTIKQILISCLIHPVFLQHSEGRKFLSCLFGLSLPFVDHLHETIKGQLPLCKKSLRVAYAEVYYRAWSTATGPYLHKLEYNCIQDLMTSAVHAANKNVVEGLRGVLGYFHEQKLNKRGIDNMLTRLYEPIIWRSLKVANQFVRVNAAWLFLDAFPIMDEDLPTRELDETMQKQFKLLQELLADPTPAVRVIAIHGACQILGKYWERHPVAASRGIINKLINELALDSTSSAVRAAVFSGLRHLLDNTLSHGTLKILLKDQGKFLHDNSEQVRAAFLDLLVAIKGIASIRFLEVAAPELILARLPIEGPTIGGKITALLLDIYCPLTDSKEACIRCISMLEANPLPSRVFYSHIHKYVPIDFVCKLIVRLFQLVNKKDSVKDAENQPIPREVLEGAVELIDTLWTTAEPQLNLPGNQSNIDGLHKSITNSGIQSIYSWMSNKGKATLLRIASHLPATKTVTLYEDVVLPAFSSLGDAEDEDDDEEGESSKKVDGSLCYALMACLYKWDHAEEVLTIVNEWVCLPLADATGSGAKKSNKRTKTGSKGKNKKTIENAAQLVTGDSSSKPLLALKLLGMLLQNKVTRDITLAQQQLQVQTLLIQLTEYLPYLQHRLCNACGLELELVRSASEKDLAVSDELLLEAFVLYSKLLIHINGTAPELEKDIDAWKNLVELVSVAFVPAFNMYSAPEEGEAESDKSKKGKKRKTSENGTPSTPSPASPLPLPVLLALNISRIMTDFAVLGFAGSETLPLISKIFEDILANSTDKDILRSVSPYISKFIYFMYETTPAENWDKNFPSTTNLIKKVLANLPSDLQASSNFKLVDILGILYRKGALLPFLKEVMPIVWGSIEEASGTPLSPPTMEDIGASTKFVLTSFSSSGHHLGVLASHLNQFIADSEDGDRVWKVLQVISLIVNSVVARKITGQSALQNVLISILSKLPSTDASSSSTFSDKQLQAFADSLLKQSLREKTPKNKEKESASV